MGSLGFKAPREVWGVWGPSPKWKANVEGGELSLLIKQLLVLLSGQNKVDEI